MNMAFLLSKCEKLDPQQKDAAVEWLTELMDEQVGGQESCLEVLKYATATLIK